MTTGDSPSSFGNIFSYTLTSSTGGTYNNLHAFTGIDGSGPSTAVWFSAAPRFMG